MLGTETRRAEIPSRRWRKLPQLPRKHRAGASEPLPVSPGRQVKTLLPPPTRRQHMRRSASDAEKESPSQQFADWSKVGGAASLLPINRFDTFADS